MKKNSSRAILIIMFLLAFCIPTWAIIPGDVIVILVPVIENIQPNSGPVGGGTRVVITGVNFVSGATVRFGNLLGTGATVLSSTQIVVYTPQGTQGPVNVTVTNPNGTFDIEPGGYTYLSPPNVFAGDDQTADEGDMVNVEAVFADNFGDTHIAKINWGDGTVTDGVIVYSPYVVGIPITTATVTGSHAYGDNGKYTVTVTVTDNYGASDSDKFVANIDNENPRISNISSKTLKEGSPTLNLTVEFSDKGWLDRHSARIYWGDDDAVIIPVANSPFTRSHTYRDDDGQYKVSVEVYDDDGGDDSETFAVTVYNENPVITTIGDISVKEGDPTASLSVTFTDPSSLDTHTASINWGDGIIESIAPATSPINVKHTYAKKNNTEYSASVTVTDDNNGSDTEEFRVIVTNENPVMAPIGNQTASECTATVSFSVIFTDPGLDTHRLIIGWGDSKTDIKEGVVSPYTATHTYNMKDDAQYTVGVVITDQDGGSDTESLLVTVANENPVIKTELADKLLTECDPKVDLRVSFTDCSPRDTHTATIDWGDGVVVSGDLTEAVVSGVTTGTVVGSHTYKEDDGAYIVTVTLEDDDGGLQSKSFAVTVANENPVIQTELADRSLRECDPTLELQAGFTDCGSLDTHAATIDWGDGVVESAGITEVVVAGNVSGTLTGIHTYAKDDGTYTVKVTVEDDNGGLHSKSFTVTVVNGKPAIQTELADQTRTECDPKVDLQLAFTDCSPLDTHTATIDWGDGQITAGDVTGTVFADAISGTVTGSHEYAEDDGTYTAKVTVQDDNGGAHSKSFKVTVSNEIPVIQAELKSQTVSECNPTVNLQAAFTDCGSLDTHKATIDWGDGQITAGNVTEAIVAGDVSGTLTGSHTYAKDNGTYTVKATVQDDNGGVATRSFAVTVTNEAPVVQSDLADQTLSECDPILNLQVSFTDCGSLDTHKATIDWGDGQNSAGNVTESVVSGVVSGAVTGSHTYARDDNAYTVTVTVEDDNGGIHSGSFNVSVVNENPVIQPELPDELLSECDPTLKLQVSFTDCSPLDTHTAVIDWGDGQDTVGIVTESVVSGVVSGVVTGSHTYIKDDATGGNAHKVTITVQDDDGGIHSESFNVSVANDNPVIQTRLPDLTLKEGDPTVKLELSFTDCSNLDTHTALISWGDGKTDTIDPATSPLTISHTYAKDDGVYTVNIAITDDNGGKDARAFVVTVINENPDIADVDDQNILGSNPVVKLSIAYTDPGTLDTHSMIIDWGDGKTDTIDPAVSPVDTSHTYSSDTNQYVASIKLEDDDNGTDTESFTVSATNDDPIIEPMSDLTIPESKPTINLSAIFTDPGITTVYSAIIDWGDGKKDTVDPAVSPVTAAHTYAGDDGQYKVSVTVTEKDGGSDTKSFMVTVINENPVVNTINDQNLKEGDPVYTLNAIFADPGLLDTHTATIDWGDGKTDVVSPAVSPINIKHTYPGDDGQYKVTVAVMDDDGGKDAKSFTVTVDNEVPVFDPVSDQSISEGKPTIEISLSFADPGALDTHTAVIDWGDGNAFNIDPAVSPIKATHTYPGDDGEYAVSITLQDDDGGTVTELFTVTVDNENPVIIPLDDLSVAESNPTVAISVVFFDVGALDTHTAVFDWGDGSIDTADPAVMPLAIAHTFAAEGREFAVNITIIDDDEGSGAESFIVHKISENPFIDPVNDQTLNEGNPVVNLSISFAEAGTGPPVWSQSGLVSFKPDLVNDGVLDKSAFHTDKSGPGSWLQFDTGIGNKQDFVRVEITAYSNPVGAIWDVQYSDDAINWATAFSGAGGAPFGPGTFNYEWDSTGAHRYWRLYKINDAMPGGYHSEVQFHTAIDTITEITHAAKIVWGDGLSDDIDPAVSPINANHTYPYDNGVYTATIIVTSSGGGVHSRSFGVTVDNVAPVVNAGDDQTVDKANPVAVKASFTDVGLLDTHTAIINWGDGASGAAAVAENNGSGTVTGSHSYINTGSYTVTVSVTDDDMAVGRDSLVVDIISGPAPIVTSISPNSGTTSGGTAVTITGRNFQTAGVTTVSIGNAAASGVQVVSAVQINANTPSGSIGAADVVVTNPDKQQGTLRNGFTYIGPVVRLSISPQTATVQIGQAQQYSVSGVDSAGSQASVTNTDVNWAVADAGVGTISTTGLFTATGYGETNITAVLKTNSSIRAEAEASVPDTEPPSILSEEIFPAPEDQHVPVTSGIPIAFSEPVDLGSAAGGGVKVTGKDNRNIEGEYEFDPDTGILTFIPAEPFKDEETITVAVTRILMDMAGNRLEKEFQATFTTGIGLRPGDANNDGEVNTQDIIPLGQFWNMTGEPRDDASSDWALQPAVPWSIRMATYADANGDGKVNEQDILPIAANWMLTHTPNSLAPSQSVIEKSAYEDTRMLDIYSAMYDVLDAIPVETEGVRALKAAIGEMMTNIRRQLSPGVSKLLQNYPNPFNPETWIPYQLSEEAFVRVNIYDLNGRLVRTLEIGQRSAGYYLSKDKAAYWDGRNQFGEKVASGIYFYHLKAGKFESVRKLISVQ